MNSVVLLTNIMTPYRKFFYDELHRELKNRNINFHVVLMARTEPNRNWNYEDYKTEYSILLRGKTVTVGGVFIHINKGIKKLYKKLKPDVVVCAGSYLYPALWETQKLSKKFDYMTYYWSESHLGEVRNYSGLKTKLREGIRKKVIGGFDGFWYAGKLSREFIECYARKNANYIFVSNLINEKKFDAVNSYSIGKRSEIKKLYNIPDGKKVLLTPARLSPVKGIMEFLELYKDVAARSNAIYLIAGDGELKEAIEKFSREHQLDVRLLGYKSEDEMLDLYAIADVFVMPSLSDPNPLTCIEACWCSLPLLVSKHVGNYPELVEEGVNGFVIDYGDTIVSIEKIQEIITADENWYRSAEKYSNSVAAQRYSSENEVYCIVKEMIRRNDTRKKRET